MREACYLLTAALLLAAVRLGLWVFGIGEVVTIMVHTTFLVGASTLAAYVLRE